MKHYHGPAGRISKACLRVLSISQEYKSRKYTQSKLEQLFTESGDTLNDISMRFQNCILIRFKWRIFKPSPSGDTANLMRSKTQTSRIIILLTNRRQGWAVRSKNVATHCVRLSVHGLISQKSRKCSDQITLLATLWRSCAEHESHTVSISVDLQPAFQKIRLIWAMSKYCFQNNIVGSFKPLLEQDNEPNDASDMFWNPRTHAAP